MLIYLKKDKGSALLPPNTKEDLAVVLSEYNSYLERAFEYGKLNKRIDDFIKIHTSNFFWFDKDIIKQADKSNLYQFTWLLIRLYERRLDRKGWLSNYTFLREIKAKESEYEAFKKYFTADDKNGTLMVKIVSQNKYMNLTFTNYGWPLFRLIWAPLGKYFKGNLLFYSIWILIWFFLSLVDWIILGIPYSIARIYSGLDPKYYETERLIGPYIYGDNLEIREKLRELIKNDPNNEWAYFVVIWAVFLREKFIEIIIMNRHT